MEIWNSVFPEKERKVTGPPWNINSIAYEAIREGSEDEYSFDLKTYRTAFEQLKKHKTLSWLFHSAVKPNNVRQMLVEARSSPDTKGADRRKKIPENREDYPVTEKEFWNS